PAVRDAGVDGTDVAAPVERGVLQQPAVEVRRRLDGHHTPRAADETGAEHRVHADIGSDVDEAVPGLQAPLQPARHVRLPHPEEVQVPLYQVLGIDGEPGARARFDDTTTRVL